MNEYHYESSVPHAFTHFQGFVPNPVVPPGFGGPVTDAEINCNDVLSGRGGIMVNHEGSIQFRKIITQHQTNYYDTKVRLERQYIAAKIVAIVRYMNPPGRFLVKKKERGYWVEIGDEAAREKVRQALRDENRKMKQARRWLSSSNKSETSSEFSSVSLHSQPASSIINIEHSQSIQHPENVNINTNVPMSPKCDAPDNNSAISQSDAQVMRPPRKRKPSETSLTSEASLLLRNTFMSHLDDEGMSDFSDDLDFELDMHGIGQVILDFPPECPDSLARTCNRHVTLETFFGSCATTTDFMLAMSRLHCDCDVSVGSQMTFGHVNLVRTRTYDSIPRDYNNLVLKA